MKTLALISALVLLGLAPLARTAANDAPSSRVGADDPCCCCCCCDDDCPPCCIGCDDCQEGDSGTVAAACCLED